MGVRKLAEWMGLVEDGRYSDPKDELSEEYSVDEYVEPEPEPRRGQAPPPSPRRQVRCHRARAGTGSGPRAGSCPGIRGGIRTHPHFGAASGDRSQPNHLCEAPQLQRGPFHRGELPGRNGG